MSDLVEKVKVALREVEDITDDFGTVFTNIDGEARAAIRAVLAHFADPGNVTEGMCATAENIRSFVGSRIIAAAMAAALKEMENE